jgi:hypothetical protein
MDNNLTNEQIDELIENHVDKVVSSMSYEELVQFVTDDLIHNYSMMSKAELLEVLEEFG